MADCDNYLLEGFWLAVHAARHEWGQSPAMQALADPNAEPALIHGFMVQLAALSVQLQEQAEQELVAASRRCDRQGEVGLGLTLLHLAGDAIDHYRRLADDTRVLVQLWNARRPPELDLTWLLTQANSDAIRKIWAFHGELGEGERPWAEIAALYVLEGLAAELLPTMLAHAERSLGREIRAGMGSLIGLAQAGERGRARAAMVQLLRDHPERRETLVATAVRMLQLYGELFAECMVAAVNLANWRQLAHG